MSEFSTVMAFMYLKGQIVVLLFLLRSQSVPPLSKNFADCPVVLVWVTLVHQSSMALAKNHEGIHWSSDVVLLLLKGCAWDMNTCYYVFLTKWNLENFDILMYRDYLPRAVLISIFGQRAEGLSASLYWWCRQGLLWYNSREEAESRENSPLFIIFTRLFPFRQ